MKEDAHNEEVQQEALGGAWTVKVEKDQREEEREELEARVAEGRAQQLQPCNGGQQDVAAGGRSDGSEGVGCQLVNITHTHVHTVFVSTYWIPSFLRWLSAKPSLVSALSTMAGYTTYFSKHSRPT